MNRLLALLAGAAISALCHAASPRWEVVNSSAPYPSQTTELRDDQPQEQLEVSVRDGFIYVTVARSSQVKVFTILGQLISQDTLQPGIHRLRINAKGIYILKTGSATRRVII